MAHDLRDHEPWTCHWEHMRLLGRGGARTEAAVWICEHPYRTMRMDRPDECHGCPTWELHERAKARLHLTTASIDELLSGL